MIFITSRFATDSLFTFGHHRLSSQPRAGAERGSHMQTGFSFSKLVDRLASIVELSPDDLDLLARMPSSISHLGPRHHLVHRDCQPDHCHLLLQGYLCWRDLESPDGQITSIYVPGDVPDLHTIYDGRVDRELLTLGPAVVASVSHRYFREISALSSSLSRALLRLLLTDASCLRHWIVNLGSRDALTRVAHLLCEITIRLRAVGLAKDFRIPSPFTQSDLATACGISAVHANRIVQELRRSNLLQWHSKTITVTDWNGLVRLASFDPDYLRLRDYDSIEQQSAPTVAMDRFGADTLMT
ncbi:Crp/Fnr family transcriptional regulator [Bradyrhizobium sp. Leo121]|uniref:Crp/Fnr family transcriptional regulator n=1 Tax=Bradyrhizobium sp. Leo121 TaxID=1571195 RepID=UPI001FDFF67D|nr:Crp/Fnr family transcriptional regulator [Bradyrhizobium sp. Leo121]